MDEVGIEGLGPMNIMQTAENIQPKTFWIIVTWINNGSFGEEKLCKELRSNELIRSKFPNKPVVVFHIIKDELNLPL